MVSDVIGVVRQMYPARIPPLLLIGHSLGAALAVHLANSKQLPVCGLVMVDLVEGTAVESLVHMRAVVESRPVAFQSPAAAVQWALRCGALRNQTSARFSMPDQLVQSMTSAAEFATAEPVSGPADDEAANAAASAVSSCDTAVPCYCWRTDLLSSERYWSGWFAGLSDRFLSCTAPKLLLLASAERLDPTLMVAQMQGKLQVDVLHNTGHSVQEDQPADTARRILAFALRHRFSSVGDVWAKAAAASNTQLAMGAPAAANPPPAATAARASSSSNARPPVPVFHE